MIFFFVSLVKLCTEKEFQVFSQKRSICFSAANLKAKLGSENANILDLVLGTFMNVPCAEKKILEIRVLQIGEYELLQKLWSSEGRNYNKSSGSRWSSKRWAACFLCWSLRGTSSRGSQISDDQVSISSLTCSLYFCMMMSTIVSRAKRWLWAMQLCSMLVRENFTDWCSQIAHFRYMLAGIELRACCWREMNNCVIVLWQCRPPWRLLMMFAWCMMKGKVSVFLEDLCNP